MSGNDDYLLRLSEAREQCNRTASYHQKCASILLAATFVLITVGALGLYEVIALTEARVAASVSHDLSVMYRTPVDLLNLMAVGKAFAPPALSSGSVSGPIEVAPSPLEDSSPTQAEPRAPTQSPQIPSERMPPVSDPEPTLETEKAFRNPERIRTQAEVVSKISGEGAKAMAPIVTSETTKPHVYAESLTLAGLLAAMVAILVAMYRLHVSQKVRADLLAIGFFRAQIAIECPKEKISPELATALLAAAFSDVEKPKPKSRIENPLPDHPGLELIAQIGNKVFESIEFVAQPKRTPGKAAQDGHTPGSS